MAGKAQSWNSMSLGARLYVGVMVGLGTAVLAVGALHPTSHQPMKFLCYLLVAVAASRLKVNLPGITGTMSVNFLFILLGILELSFAETLALGCAAILTQCFYRDRQRRTSRVQRARPRLRCPGLLRLSRSTIQIARTICGAPGSDCGHVLRRQCSAGRDYHFAYRAQISTPHLGRLLFWSFPYTGGRRRGGLVSWLNRIVSSGRPHC
jgi:hypothetical protein